MDMRDTQPPMGNLHETKKELLFYKRTLYGVSDKLLEDIFK